MSFRTSFGAIRRLATTTIRRAETAPTSTPEASTSVSGFGALRNLFDTPSTPSSSSSTSTSELIPSLSTATGSSVGYTPLNVPPTTDPTLDLLINCLMKDGKKDEAQKMVSRILGMIQTTTNLPPTPLVRQAILLSSPSIKLLSMRKSAKTILTPRGLTERQRTRQGITWLLKASERGRKGGIPRDARIAREVLAVLEGQSDVFKWLEERHKVAYLNRSNMTAR